MSLIAPIAEWETLLRRIANQIPEAFDPERRVLNLIKGEWKDPGFGRYYESPIDGRSLGRIPMIDLETARTAVKLQNLRRRIGRRWISRSGGEG